MDPDASTRPKSLALRGWPHDADDETLAEDVFFIDDAIAKTDAGDCVDTRFCSQDQADEWVRLASARLLSADRVTSPDVFGQSWATADELEGVLPLADQSAAVVDMLADVVRTMRYLEEADFEVRAIYWFK